MIITISKAEIFNEVEKRSSIEGMVQPGKFDGLWAGSEEADILESYWIEGYTAVVQLLKRYLSNNTVTYNLSTSNQNETIEIIAAMPDRYDFRLDGSVVTDIKMLIACNILVGWLNVKAPEVAEKYDTEAKGYAEDLRVKLLYRVAPEITLTSASSDTEGFAEGESLSSAKTDTEGFVAETTLSSAKTDTEGFAKEDYTAIQKTDTEQFAEEAAISAAKTDTELLEQCRRCCKMPLNNINYGQY